MKKRVSSSNLALRFYKYDGWTRECLEPYLLSGVIVDTQEKWGDAPEIAYFVPAPYTRLDIDRLYAEQVSEVNRTFNDYSSETDLEFMKRMNG